MSLAQSAQQGRRGRSAVTGGGPWREVVALSAVYLKHMQLSSRAW